MEKSCFCYIGCSNCHTRSPHPQVLYTDGGEGGWGLCCSAWMLWTPITWSGSCSLFFHISLEASGWLSQALHLHVSGDSQTPPRHIPRKFQICVMLSAPGKAGFSTLLLSCVVLLGSYICLPAVAQWTWPCFQAMPWAKRYKEGNIKCICPEIGLSMPGTSHTGSYATGNVACFWYQMVCGQGWHSVRNSEKPDKETLHCHLLGLCWVPQSLVYILWWWNKGATDQVWVSSSQKSFTRRRCFSWPCKLSMVLPGNPGKGAKAWVRTPCWGWFEAECARCVLMRGKGRCQTRKGLEYKGDWNLRWDMRSHWKVWI